MASTSEPPQVAGDGSGGRFTSPLLRGTSLSDLGQRYSLPIVWGLVVLVFSLVEPDTFPTTANFSTIFGSQATLVILTLALLIPLTAGDYDLSIASVLTLSAMIIAQLNAVHEWPIGVAILVALAAGAVIGAINGGIVLFFGIDPFIVTLGTGTFVQGVVLWISGSNTVGGISSDLVDRVIGSRFLGIPLGFWYGVILCILIWYVFEYTPLGRRLLFVGRGRSVSRLSGIRVGRLRWGALVASATLAALAGVLYAGTTGAADPSSGLQFLLPAFAAAFLGATAIQPGRFNPWGSIIAVYFLVTGITGLQLLGVKSYVQQLFYGGALVLAVALSQLARRREVREN
jgi:ribose transport system permease protein